MKTKILIALDKKVSQIPVSDVEAGKWWRIFRKWVNETDFRKLERIFYISYQDPEIAGKCGIYKFSIGDKYWIARAQKLWEPKKRWEQQINLKILSEEQLPETDFLYPFISHIDATGILEGTIILLEECGADNMQYVEQKWLDKANGDINCLNTSFIAKERGVKK